MRRGACWSYPVLCSLSPGLALRTKSGALFLLVAHPPRARSRSRGSPYAPLPRNRFAGHMFRLTHSVLQYAGDVCTSNPGWPMPAEAAARCRPTEGLTQALAEIGVAVVGEGGSRLAGALPTTASPAHLLRLLRRTPIALEESVGVLGIDDRATPRGRSCGAILANLERRCPIDLLPDGTSATLASWLQEHARVEILSRDRGTDDAEGGRQGAPGAGGN